MENANKTPIPALSASDMVSPSSRSMNEAKQSLREIFDAEESALLRFAYGIVGQRETAEDIVQDAFLRLHQHWAEVDSPRAWLYRSIRNLSINHLRDHRRETAIPEGAEWQSDAPDAAAVLGKMEAVGVLRMLMAEMREDDRDILRCKYQSDMSYEAISKRTGLSISHVGYKLHHIIKGLADSLRRMGVESVEG